MASGHCVNPRLTSCCANFVCVISNCSQVVERANNANLWQERELCFLLCVCVCGCVVHIMSKPPQGLLIKTALYANDMKNCLRDNHSRLNGLDYTNFEGAQPTRSNSSGEKKIDSNFACTQSFLPCKAILYFTFHFFFMRLDEHF